MNAAEMMLLVSRTTQETIDSIATGGSVSTLTDSLLKRKAEYFDGGTLWITRGTPVTTVVKDVTQYGNETATFTPAEGTPTPGAIVAGNTYSIAVNKFSRLDLLQAVNQALSAYLYPVYDTSLTTVLGQEDYSLPDGVADCRVVEIAQNAAAPYNYLRNRNWREVGGVLTFIDGSQSAGRKIRILYPGTPAAVTATSTIPASINTERLKWAAIEHLWRRRLQLIENDSPTEKELMNEAKTNIEVAKRQAKAPYIPPRELMMAHA